MTSKLITARLMPRATIHVAPVWIGGTPVVQIRLDHDALTPNGQGQPIAQSLVQRIQWSVYRLALGTTTETLLADYSAADLDIAAHWESELEKWSLDAYGWQFRHIVPAAAVATPGLYRLVYWFTLSDGEVVAVPVRFPVLGPLGTTAGTGGGGGAPPIDPTDEEEALMYSLTSGVTISGSSAELTFLNTGVGTLVVPADLWPAGALFRCRGSGWFRTRPVAPGTFTWRQKVATDAVLAIELNLPANQTTFQPFQFSAEMVRIAAGPTGTITGQCQATLQAGVTQEQGIEGWSAPQVVSSEAAKTFDLTGQFSTSDPANQIYFDRYTIQRIKVGALL